MKILGWKAWYTQNRVYSSTETTWENLPKKGVLFVVVFYATGSREILNGVRRYFQATGSSGNKFIKGSLWQQKTLLDTYETSDAEIKEGVWDDDETVARIAKEASEAQWHG